MLKSLSLKYRHLKINNFLITLAIIGASGCNWTILLLIGATALLVLTERIKLNMNNCFIAIGLSVILYINSFVVNAAEPDMHEYFVFVSRFVCLAVVCSYIDYKRFFEMYTGILYYVFLVCLFFWVVLFLFNNIGLRGVLPSNIFNHIMMDSTSRFLRLKAIFWEGGVCAIHANIALTYCICKGVKETKKYAIVFLAAVICSLSTTGFLVLGLQGLLYVIREFKGFRVHKHVIFLIFICVVMFVLEELTVGVIYAKLIGHGSSFTSRYDDTLLGLLVARDHFWSGVGVAGHFKDVFLEYFYNDLTYRRLRKYAVPDLASSNGLVNCMYTAGIPFTVLYLGIIYFKLHYKIGFKVIESMIILAMYMCFFFGEPIMSVPFMLMFFYDIDIAQDKKKTRKRELCQASL